MTHFLGESVLRISKGKGARNNKVRAEGERSLESSRWRKRGLQTKPYPLAVGSCVRAAETGDRKEWKRIDESRRFAKRLIHLSLTFKEGKKGMGKGDLTKKKSRGGGKLKKESSSEKKTPDSDGSFSFAICNNQGVI